MVFVNLESGCFIYSNRQNVIKSGHCASGLTRDEDLTYNYLFKKGSSRVISSPSVLNYDFHNIKKKHFKHRAKKITCKTSQHHPLGSSIYHVVKFLGILTPLLPSWSLIRNNAYVIKWSFG